MDRSLRPLVAAAALVLGAGAPLAACHRPTSRESSTRDANAPEARTVLRVDNRSFPDMVIYVIPSSGERQRLGIATGSSTTTFPIPARLIAGASTLRFLADPVGGQRAPVSEEIAVRPGDQIELTIPPQ